jgi:hypothetical protein
MWNASIVVENRAGASGTIGSLEGARAPADGYTLTMGNTQTHGMNSALFANLKFDVIRDIQPVVLAPTRKRGYLPERFRDGLRRRWTNADPGFGFWIGVGFRSADA